MNEDLAKQLIQNAISNEPEKREIFARRLAELVTFLPQQLVRTQFIEFLTNWIDPENETICVIVSSQLLFVAHRAGGVVYIAPIVSVLSRKVYPQVMKNIINSVNHFIEDSSSYEFARRIATDQYDTTRSLIPRIIQVVPTLDKKRDILEMSIKDKSFYVRMAVLKSIPKFETELARFAAVILTDDPSDKLKSLLSSVCIQQQFWSTQIVSRLQDDHSWLVRASIAKAAPKFRDPSMVIQTVIDLTSDPSWEVKLSALQSLKILLDIRPMLKFNDPADMIRNYLKMINNYQISSMKCAVVDVIFSVIKRGIGRVPPEVIATFVTEVLNNQSSPVKLYLLSIASRSALTEFAPFLQDNFQSTVESILLDKKWRIRQELADLFPEFSDLFRSQQTSDSLLVTAMKLVNDEAYQVRLAAARYIAYLSFSRKEGIPKSIETLKASNSFRARQAALDVLNELMKMTEDSELKNIIVTEIKSFEKDQYPNVLHFAKQYDPDFAGIDEFNSRRNSIM